MNTPVSKQSISELAQNLSELDHDDRTPEQETLFQELLTELESR